MSRTYRLRHLPRMRSRKFVDSSIHRHRFPVEQELDRILEERFGKSWPTFGIRWSISWNLCRYDPAWFTPVACMHDHPWVRWWWAGNSAKAWHRSQGNKNLRRRTRSIIKSKFELLDDDWQGHFPSRHEYFDKWDLS